MQLTPRRGPVRGFFWILLVTLLAVARTGPAGAADPEKTDGRPSRDTSTEAPLEEEATVRSSVELAAYADSNDVTVLTPSVGAGIEDLDGASFSATYLVDVVSAASVDIVSTASPRWEEVRHAGTLSADYQPGDYGVGVGASISSEPDYLSYGGYVRLMADFDEKNWSLFVGVGASRDTIGRCGGIDLACTPFVVFSREVDRTSLNGGVSVVIDPASVVSLTLDAIFDRGDQSKPYRHIPLFSPSVAPTVPLGADVDWVNANRLPEAPFEQLPLERDRLAATVRYARRMGSSTIRLMERGYTDSWGMFASSTDARFLLDLGRRLTVGPHGRFHVQNAVTFWRRAYVSGTGWDLPLYRTGDRELGPLWAATGGFSVSWGLGSAANPNRWTLTLNGDVIYTSFLDDLYILNRTGGLGALTVGGAF